MAEGEATNTLRDACPADAAAISDTAMQSKAYWGYSDEFMEQCRSELEVDAERLQDPAYQYRVAERDGDIVGFHAIADLAPGRFELEGLFVRPKFIGSGVGRALIKDAMRLVAERGGGQIIIQGDPNAERFYLAAGAKHAGTRESGSVAGRMLPLFQINVAASGNEGATL